MTNSIIDRRENPRGRSFPNRRRLLRREKKAIKDAVERSIEDPNVQDNIKKGTKNVRVKPISGTRQPEFRHKPGGVMEGVLPGNKEFIKGDKISRPQGGAGGSGGDEGSQDGESQDDFFFELSRKEYLDILFEGMVLPNLTKRQLSTEEEVELRRGGFMKEGSPNKLDLVRSMQASIARKRAFRIPKLRKIRELQEERENIENDIEENGADEEKENRIQEIEKEVEVLRRRLRAIPFLDPEDLSYKRHEQVPTPMAKAVVFFLMDVSASMTQSKKNLAKGFFDLFQTFLERYYEHSDIVYIRHTHEAQEVDEHTFFYDTQSGGTVISSALVKMIEIIKERYPLDQWNIYVGQASDGEDFASDVDNCVSLLEGTILPIVQYYVYLETLADTGAVVMKGLSSAGSIVWKGYFPLKVDMRNFDMDRISKQREVYTAFRRFFAAHRSNKK